MKKFEYWHTHYSSSVLVEKLNEAGAKGWQLVHLFSGSPNVSVLLMREITETEQKD